MTYRCYGFCEVYRTWQTTWTKRSSRNTTMTRIRNQWRGVKTSIFCRKICRDKSEIPICWAKPLGKQRIFNEWKIYISSMQKVVMKYCINSSIVWLSVSRCPCLGKRKTSGLFLWAYVWKVFGQLWREKDNFVQITPYSPKITRVESIRYCSQCSGFSSMTSSFLLLDICISKNVREYRPYANEKESSTYCQILLCFCLSSKGF